MRDASHVIPGSGLHVVIGHPVDLEASFLERIADLRAADPLSPIDVLVGGVLQRPYLQRRIADTSPGMINVRISTLGELGVRLGEVALSRGGRRPLPAIAERAYAAEVGRGATGYFEAVAGSPGFAEVARRVVRELRQEGVAEARLSDVAPEGAESPAKGRAVADLYVRYMDGRRGYYDGEDALAVADPARFDGGSLLLFGVWRLSAVARHLLERLGQRVPVIVHLPSAGTEGVDAVHDELRTWAESVGGQILAVPASVPGDTLTRLQRRLFSFDGAIEIDKTVDLVTAPDALTEVREAARACLAWASEGIAFREMAVTYRQATMYRPLIEATFSEAGIPLYLDDGPSLAERPLGRRVLGLLDLIGSDLPRRQLMSFLSDGWMPKETRERFGGANIAQWDSASRRAGVVTGLAQWRQRMRFLSERERERADEPDAPEWLVRRADHSEALLAFVEDFARRLASLPQRASWSASLAALKGLMEPYVQDCEDVLGYLAALDKLDGLVPEVDFERFVEVVRSEVRALKASDVDDGRQGAFGLRGVNILDANAIRGIRFRAVAVLGLTERSFPPPPRQDPLLLDEERQSLNRLGGWSLPLRARGADPEPMQFALAVTAARERLFLGTRRADESGGRVTLPSSFFRAAAGALHGGRVRVEDVEGLSFVRRIAAAQVGAADIDLAATLPERDRTLLSLDPVLGRGVLMRLQPSVARSNDLRQARWQRRLFTAYDGVFASPEAIAALKEQLEHGRPLSPTAMETYATCPLQYFLGKVLRLSPLEEPEELVRITPQDKGSLMHLVLDGFYRDLPGGRLDSANRDLHQERLRRIAEGALDDAEIAGKVGARLLWAADRQEILDDLAAWLDQELTRPATYVHRVLEAGFGFDGEQPLALQAGDVSLRLRGRIDRIDHDDQSFRVVDYKSGGGTRVKPGELKGGSALQLPLYVLAGAMLLGRDPARGEAEFQNISRRGGLRTVPFTAQQFAERRADFVAILDRIVGGVSTGDFHAEPSDDNCRYCDFNTLCDVGRQRIKQRKEDDPNSVSYAAMKAIK